MLNQPEILGSEGNEDADSSERKVVKEVTETKREIEGFIGNFAEEDFSFVGNPGVSCVESDAAEDPCAQSKKTISEADLIGFPDGECEILKEDITLRLTEVDTHNNGISEAPVTAIRDIKKKIPGLFDLTLPTTPETLGTETSDIGKQTGVPSTDSSDSDSNEASSPIVPLLRRISLPAHGRLKTRLQDPPPLTPAVQSQLTHCSSSLLRRRASSTWSALNKQQNTRVDGGSSRKAVSEGVETNSAQPVSSLAVDSFNLKANVNAPSTLDEDKDALDDDNIPASKKRKTQENKWVIFMQWFSLFLLVAFLACSMKIKSLKTITFLGLNLWRWEALTLVVFCGRLISGWIVQVLVMLIEKQYILKKRVLYFVYGLRRSVKNCVWLALVLGVWEGIFQGLEDNKAVSILTKILWCLFTASLSWMVKVLAVKVAANSFHRTAYFDRIQECIFNQYLLEKLSGPPTMEGIADAGVVQDGYKKQLTRSEKRKRKNKFVHSSKDQGSCKAGPPSTQTIERSCSPKNMEEGLKRSRRLQRQIVVETQGHTTVEVCEVPASACPDTLTSSRRRASLNSPGPLIARSPIPIEQEKLQELTSDTVSVWTLRRLMKLIRQTNITTYSSILSQEQEDGEISSEVQARAAAKQEMNVLNTILLGPSNEKVYYPNALLSVKAIANCYRSPDQGDAIEFQINMTTPVEKLGMLKERMQRYIEGLPQFWYPDFRIVCEKIQDSNKMSMAVWLRHRLNFQDPGERFQRKSNMLLYFKQQLEDLGVVYQLPGQQITVTGIPAISVQSLQ